MMTSGKLCNISFAVAGVVFAPLVGLAGLALVRASMRTKARPAFGTVAAGVGTMHAPLVAGGIMLQASSAALLTAEGVAIGAATGAVVGAGIGLANK